jgi:hypothetical protein
MLTSGILLCCWYGRIVITTKSAFLFKITHCTNPIGFYSKLSSQFIFVHIRPFPSSLPFLHPHLTLVALAPRFSLALIYTEIEPFDLILHKQEHLPARPQHTEDLLYGLASVACT